MDDANLHLVADAYLTLPYSAPSLLTCVERFHLQGAGTRETVPFYHIAPHLCVPHLTCVGLDVTLGAAGPSRDG